MMRPQLNDALDHQKILRIYRCEVVWNIRKRQGVCVPDHKFTSLYEVAYRRKYSRVLTAQKTFLNNLENVVNHRADIWEDIKCYQDTLSYTLSEVLQHGRMHLHAA